MERQMATVKEISSISPIEGADRIEVAHVGGWQCVVRKGEFSVGQKVLYFEIDTFLPSNDKRYASFAERSTRRMVKDGVEYEGHVLKTIKLRGTLSQGLIMPMGVLGIDTNMFEVGTDVTEQAGVWKYKPPFAIGRGGGALGRFDTSVAPITDAVRVQNISPQLFEHLKSLPYHASIKVDGMSMTCCFDPRRDAFRIFTHHRELDPSSEGNAKFMRVAEESGIKSFCEAHPGISVQWELAGGSVQSDRLKLGAPRAFVFAAWEFGSGAPIKLNIYEDERFAPLRRILCPLSDIDLKELATIEDAVSAVDGLRGCVTKDRLDEGVVLHFIDADDGSDAVVEARRKLGQNMEVKIISNKYLIKENG